MWATDYGVVADGTTDNYTGLTAAIAALGTAGGVVRLPAGEINCGTSLDLSGKFGVTLRGAGKSPTLHNQATVLKFTGTTGPFLNVKSSNSITIQDIRIVHTSASFTGYLLDGSHSTSSDTSQLVVERCHFGSYDGLQHTAFGMQLDKVISSTIRDCTFDALAGGIDGQNPAGGSYSNVITLDGCSFNDVQNVPVRYCGESWNITGCTFEPRQSGIAGAVQTTALTPIKGMNFSGNWLGDVSPGSSTWIILYGKGATFTGNRFGGTATGAAISLNAFTGFTASGNAFVLFNTVFSFDTAGCTDFIEFSNNYDTCTSIYGTTGNQNSFATGTTGYTILPNGMLMQYGRSTVTTGTPLAITFGKAFSNANYAFTATPYSPSGANNTVYATTIGTTGITLNVNGTAGSSVVHWHAIGEA